MTILRQYFVAQCVEHLQGDFLPKIRTAVEELSEQQLWWRPNENSNSVGNLLLHLEGNVRQWIVAGIGGAPDDRKRQREFEQRSPLASEDLLDNLAVCVQEAIDVLEGLDEAALTASYRIQIYEVSGVSAVVHVVEHFSYHTGQILYITKMLRDLDLAFYDL